MQDEHTKSLLTVLNASKETIAYQVQDKIVGVAFPGDNTILLLGTNNYKTVCLKENKIKKCVNFREGFEDFDYRNNKLAIVTKTVLLLYDIGTDILLYSGDIHYSRYRIALCSDDTIILSGAFFKNIFIVKNKKLQRDTFFYSMFNDFNLLAAHPTNNNVFVASFQTRTGYTNNNKRFRSDTVKKNDHLVIDINRQPYLEGIEGYNENYRIKTNITNSDNAISCMYDSFGEVIAVNTKDQGVKFYLKKRGDLFNSKHYIYEWYLSILSENKKNQSTLYSSIAFHPYKKIVALLNHIKSCIEFWDYTKVTANPLDVITIDSDTNNCFIYDLSSKYMAFSPNGRLLVALLIKNKNSAKSRSICLKNKSDFKHVFFVVSTPKSVCYDQITCEKSIFFLLSMKIYEKTHFLMVMPKDIIQLIIELFVQLPDKS